jgi:hypothetical protein
MIVDDDDGDDDDDDFDVAMFDISMVNGCDDNRGSRPLLWSS